MSEESWKWGETLTAQRFHVFRQSFIWPTFLDFPFSGIHCFARCSQCVPSQQVRIREWNRSSWATRTAYSTKLGDSKFIFAVDFGARTSLISMRFTRYLELSVVPTRVFSIPKRESPTHILKAHPFSQLTYGSFFVIFHPISALRLPRICAIRIAVLFSGWHSGIFHDFACVNNRLALQSLVFPICIVPVCSYVSACANHVLGRGYESLRILFHLVVFCFFRFYFRMFCNVGSISIEQLVSVSRLYSPLFCDQYVKRVKFR